MWLPTRPGEKPKTPAPVAAQNRVTTVVLGGRTFTFRYAELMPPQAAMSRRRFSISSGSCGGINSAYRKVKVRPPRTTFVNRFWDATGEGVFGFSSGRVGSHLGSEEVVAMSSSLIRGSGGGAAHVRDTDDM